MTQQIQLVKEYSSTIYIRRGTSDEQVTEEELSHILERRMKHIFPVTGKPLVLEDICAGLKNICRVGARNYRQIRV